MKFSGKLMKVEQNHPERNNQDPKRQLYYIFSYTWILVIKSSINKQAIIHTTTEIRYKVIK